jgi:hypothetical protein
MQSFSQAVFRPNAEQFFIWGKTEYKSFDKGEESSCFVETRKRMAG